MGKKKNETAQAIIDALIAYAAPADGGDDTINVVDALEKIGSALYSVSVSLDNIAKAIKDHNPIETEKP